MHWVSPSIGERMTRGSRDTPRSRSSATVYSTVVDRGGSGDASRAAELRQKSAKIQQQLRRARASIKAFLGRQADTQRSHLEDMPPRLKKGLHAAIRAAATAGGVLFAYTQKQSTLMISICYVAAGNVLKAATDMVNPVLRSNDLDALVLTADDPAFATAHVALAAVGVLAQLSGAPIPLPVRILFKPVLAPLALVEKALCAATLNNIRKGL